MMRSILILSLLFFSACTFHNVPYWREGMFEGPPPGPYGNQYPEKYVSGWKDGCYTAGGATANQLYKFRYGFRQDAVLIDDRQYRKGWDDAYLYCTSYLLQHNFDFYGVRIL